MKTKNNTKRQKVEVLVKSSGKKAKRNASSYVKRNFGDVIKKLSEE